MPRSGFKKDMYLLQNHQFQGSIELLRLLAEFPSPLDVGIKKDPSSDDDSDTLGLQYSYCCNCFEESDCSDIYDTNAARKEIIMPEAQSEINLPSCLRPIDSTGLHTLAEKGKRHPESGKMTLKAKTVTEGQFRNVTYIRDLAPVVIDEPPHLLGQNTAPNPSEAVLAAFGACLAVGYIANATERGIQLRDVSIELEGDIDVSAVWGLGDAREGKIAGFTTIRVKAHLDADAPQEVLAEIVEHATNWSPVANTLRNPVSITAALVSSTMK